MVWSFVHTSVQQIHAGRSATKRSVSGLTKPVPFWTVRTSRVEDEEEATWRPSPIGDQSGLDLDGGDVLGNDN